MNVDVIRSRRLIVLHAQCAAALSLCKIMNSAEIFHSTLRTQSSSSLNTASLDTGLGKDLQPIDWLLCFNSFSVYFVFLWTVSCGRMNRPATSQLFNTH